MSTWQIRRPEKDRPPIEPGNISLKNILENNSAKLLSVSIGAEMARKLLEQARRREEHAIQYVQQIAAASGESAEVCAALVSKAEGRGIEPDCICQAMLIGYSIQEIESLLNKDNAAHIIHVIVRYHMQPGERVAPQQQDRGERERK